MVNKKNHSEDKNPDFLEQIVEETIKSLDNSKKCDARDDFSDNVMDSIIQSENNKSIFSPDQKLHFAYAMIILIMLIDGVAIAMTNSVTQFSSFNQSDSGINIEFQHESILDEFFTVKPENLEY